MRVVSQNGLIDVPYERNSFVSYKNTASDSYVIISDGYRMAEYEKEEIVKKELTEMRNRYANGIPFYHFSKGE